MQQPQIRKEVREGLSYLQKIILQVKKRWFFERLTLILEERQEIMTFVDKENQAKLHQFLNSDKFQFDNNQNIFIEDGEVQPQNVRFKQIPIKHLKQSSDVLTKKDLNFQSTSLHTSTEHYKKGSIMHFGDIPKNVLPLWVQGWFPTQEESEQEHFANRIRQTKTKRELFKTRFQEIEQQKRENMLKQEKSKNKLQEKSNKKDKFQYLNHYVDMEVTFHEPSVEVTQEQPQQNKQKFKIKNKKQSKSLKSSPIKIAQKNLIYTTRKWEPLVPQSRQLLLQSSQKMKLTPGVTVRESVNKPSYMFNSNASKKKIHHLKNSSQGNPLKLKFNELLSYKRLGSLTHLAYCSSMKTVKDIKDATDTNISIDSKQLVPDQTESRRLIKIVNKRVYDQLLFDYESMQGETGKNRPKAKLKKEGKVRFNNMGET